MVKIGYLPCYLGFKLANLSLLSLEIRDLQARLKDSLNRTWRHSLSHDWIPSTLAKTFPLREFYVGLRWIRIVRRAIKNFREELTSIYDIFDLPDAQDTSNATNILVTGKDCTLTLCVTKSMHCFILCNL